MVFDYPINLEIHQDKFCTPLGGNVKDLLNSETKKPGLRDNSKIIQKFQQRGNAQAELKDLSQKMMLANIDNRERLHNVWQTVKENQDLRIRNKIEARDLEFELRDLRKMKGKLELHDREKELKELEAKQNSIKNAIKQYHEEENYTIKNENDDIRDRIEKSKIFNTKSQERINKMKDMGERKASLQHKMASLMDKGESIFLETSLEDTRERINKLIREKEKTMNQYKANLTSDDPFNIIEVQDNPKFYGISYISTYFVLNVCTSPFFSNE
ncbi:unnamed protein product [Moneuplotes crassus]|uniref:Uncharacterized protein n=1 Tax=Euplotes crassus TaxID=5936 RepID=A0AAD2DB18_EUPCR|nr:unnamed protein product [Moneuplotes crassus]